jgi:hypothetical protein
MTNTIIKNYIKNNTVEVGNFPIATDVTNCSSSSTNIEETIPFISEGQIPVTVPPTPQVYGCMDTTAINYNPFATANDGSCVYLNEVV